MRAKHDAVGIDGAMAVASDATALPVEGADGGAGVPLARLLFPELATQLDSALAVHGTRDAAAVAAAAADTELDRAASQLLPHAAFADVAGAAATAFAERSFAAARTAAGWLGVSLPEPEAFAAAGVDLAEIARVLPHDDEARAGRGTRGAGREGGAATGEYLAVPAPHGLGRDRWIAGFTRAAESGAGQAYAESAEGAPLVLGPEAEREFPLLNAAPEGSPAVPGADAVWTLRAVPSGARPPVLGLGFDHGPHATLPEMLMLQLMRAAAGEPPVDSASFTWLAGPLSEGRLAARHVYDASERAIRITCREIGNQGPHLGARTPLG
ncbi:hypothetical protein [Leucobacter japonicus]|uniref:hypothetical protein n=1 Tax=Leucobacter japonicus TaxID=1461259 RepID=UPI000A89BBE3|nr:hypothetical protein [Leucobacter japonicus]